MHEAVAHVNLDDRLHAGFIIIRSAEQRKRGILLLNVSETEARIKFMPGFVSASLFSGPDGVVAEYVQWRSQDDLSAAFTTPAFAEHLPVVRAFATGETFMFGTPTTVIAPNGGKNLALSSQRFAVVMFTADPEEVEAREAEVAEWARSLTTANGGAIVVADHGQHRIGVLLLGDFTEMPEVTEALSAEVLERVGPLELYCSVTEPDAEEEPLDYVMAME